MRRSVRDTIRAAEEHLLQSEAIVSQSAVMLDRARETLQMVKSSREQRHRDHKAANSANENNFLGRTH